MNRGFFSKLALRNLKSNKQIYLPYIFASIATVAMFYMMVALMGNKFVQTRNASLPMMFTVGAVVIGVFSFLFVLYTNSFLIKRRKKEIGLYAILGMKKKHVSRILTIESLVTSSFSIIVGLILGHLLGELAFLILNYALQFGVKMSFPFTLNAVIITIGLFVLIFLVTLLYNITQVTFSNPIQLIKGKQTGEREPKSSIILFILSLLLIGSGYYLSVMIDNPMDAMLYFLLAVLLVIVGTYFLFISGSIFILKALKKNKKLYYRPSPFISISGMLYRMKQNAVGLANITILATMVIVAVSTTIAVFIGIQGTLDVRFPYENKVTYYTEANLEEEFKEIQKETEATGLEVTGTEIYTYYNLNPIVADNELILGETDYSANELFQAKIIVQEDYEKMTNQSIDLESNEILIYDLKDDYDFSTLLIGDEIYQIKSKIENPIKMDEWLSPNMILVVESKEVLQSIIDYNIQASEIEYDVPMEAMISWNTTGTQEQKKSYSEKLADKLNSREGSYFESKELLSDALYDMNGGFLFLGIFLGLLFTFGAALITYFKQVSEGYDDREKFQIMQKVGLDKQMIRKTTRLQIIWMFLLPLVIAVIHVAFAFPIIQKLLLLFNVVDTTLIFWCFASVIVGYSVIYGIIYQVTSKVYYSIVK
ncbi:FtsX-like permease family protein [Carnobacterium viridans]|uniref:Putative ABC transport system permease protein n=1 Tax=Carnobacterium viridans TaxID=174587 RepID=A0A1H1A340_9LACT|nr:FtsX-like permease family protein [Carnobacterium viridans]UDE94330.1 FtsX-like permease family protein [Carnobacterium viridans]SDQ34058.1 putative ABC transport system permease protein [Carnobacterium viridans]